VRQKLNFNYYFDGFQAEDIKSNGRLWTERIAHVYSSQIANKITALSPYAKLVFIFIAVSYNISVFAGGWGVTRIFVVIL
jgi:hypothetical protein